MFGGTSADIGEGWTGVVGANGSGKSTLLSLIAGELEPEGGMLTLDPSDAVVIRCRQEVESPDTEITSLAMSSDAIAHRWIGRLALDGSDLDRWGSLSPGERKRWQLAAALAAEPDILLLDEPTNHLDVEARTLVAASLARFSGVGLVISHDRDFLDALTTRTLRLTRGAVELWGGSYSTAREEWLAIESQTTEQYETAKRQEKAARRRLGDQRRQAETRSSRFQGQLRRADPKDHDATSTAARGRHAKGEASAAQRMSATRAELDRATEERREFALESSHGGPIVFAYEPSPKRLLFGYAGPLTVGGRTLVEHVDVGVNREDRILLTGPNGAGKTTLIHTLIEHADLPEERLLFLPQEITEQDARELFERLLGLDRERRGRVLAVVSALSIDPDELLMSRRPSPGEARKLALALGLGTNSWCLLLDEPTNHLDLDSVERVEAALREFPGAMLIVTHDEAFARATTDTSWALEGGVLETGH